MEGESGADSGAPRASPPRPPLAYEHLALYIDKRCILPEHERALKQHLYNRTFGIAHIRGFASRAPIFSSLSASLQVSLAARATTIEDETRSARREMARRRCEDVMRASVRSTRARRAHTRGTMTVVGKRQR